MYIKNDSWIYSMYNVQLNKTLQKKMQNLYLNNELKNYPEKNFQIKGRE